MKPRQERGCVEIVNEKMFAKIIFYIHQNPAVSVYEAEQWIYSSAKHYAKMMASLNWQRFVSED